MRVSFGGEASMQRWRPRPNQTFGASWCMHAPSRYILQLMLGTFCSIVTPSYSHSELSFIFRTETQNGHTHHAALFLQPSLLACAICLHGILQFFPISHADIPQLCLRFAFIMQFKDALHVSGQPQRVTRRAHPVYGSPHPLSIRYGCGFFSANLAHLFCHAGIPVITSRALHLSAHEA